jgi:hypothetical protein
MECPRYEHTGASRHTRGDSWQGKAVTTTRLSNIKKANSRGYNLDNEAYYLSEIGTEDSNNWLSKHSAIRKCKSISECGANESGWKIVERSEKRRNKKATITRGNG